MFSETSRCLLIFEYVVENSRLKKKIIPDFTWVNRAFLGDHFVQKVYGAQIIVVYTLERKSGRK